MKKCVSCGKEIVDAAVNCLFCGSKQTAQAALNKTVLGFGTADVWKDKKPPIVIGGPDPEKRSLPPLAVPVATPAPVTPPPVRRKTPTPIPTTPAPERTPTPSPVPRRAATEPPLHAQYPFEPWARSLRVVAIVFGLLLVGAAAAPAHVANTWVFAWDAVIEGAATFANLLPLAVGVAGLVALVFGLLPVNPVVRGIVAILVGLGLLGALASRAPLAWRTLVGQGAPILLAAGLLTRAAYRAALAGRIVVTVGALAVLAIWLVPAGGALPIRALLAHPLVIDGAILVLAVLALIVAWLPAAAPALPATLLAWALLLAGPVVAIAKVFVAGGAATFQQPQLYTSIVTVLACAVLAAYGLATLVGKGCERPS